jgi:hypothetical protein
VDQSHLSEGEAVYLPYLLDLLKPHLIHHLVGEGADVAS